MPTFAINWLLLPSVVTYDERNRTILKLHLDDEWAIVFVIEKDIFCVWKHTSIELHRKTTTKTFKIYGPLRYQSKGYLEWDRKISKIIKAGSSFTEIVSNLDKIFQIDNSYLYGELNINEKQPIRLGNKESIDEIQQKSQQELSKDLERLLELEVASFADVTLKCSGASIPAHKNILSARSPVFADMFANRMKESVTNEVNILGMDESVLRALLMYMYTGKTPDLSLDSAVDLMLAAEKYQLQDLKTVCTYFLEKITSPQNVWSILVYGDMHSAGLKSFAVDYICNNCDDFSTLQKRQEWKDLRKVKPDLAMELMESLLIYKDEKLR